MATYHCSKKAFSRCPYKRFCGSANAREAELARLVKTLKYVIGLSEFELVGRIVLRDKDGREYR